MIKKILFSLLFALLLLPGATSVAQAATGVSELQSNLGTVGVGTGLGKPGDADLKGKVANVINIVLGFLGILAVIYIIYAGFKWMTAGGNEETIKEAKGSIKNAVIGILVVFASYVVVNFAVTQISRATGGGGGGGGSGSESESGAGGCRRPNGTYIPGCPVPMPSDCQTGSTPPGWDYCGYNEYSCPGGRCPQDR